MRVGCNAILIAALCGSAAHAEPRAEADAEFERGRELLKVGNYEAACSAFERSQQLDAQFGTLYNLANCYAKRGMTVSAWRAYRDLETRDSNAKRRDDSALRARELEARLPKLRVTAPSPGWRVTLNGVDVSALVDTDAPVDPGVYEVVATALGQEPFHTTARVADGETVTVAIRARGAASAVVDPIGRNPTAGPRPLLDLHLVPPDPEYTRRRRYALTAMIGGGSVMLIGLFLAKSSSDRWDHIHVLCPEGTGCADEFVQAERDELADRAHARTVGAVTLLLAGGAAVGAGIWLHKTNVRRDVPAVRVAPAPGGVMLSGRF